MLDIDARLAFSNSAKAAVDMALHDLLARRLNVPLHVLLGGAVRASVVQARILAIKPPLEMAANAARLAEQGYRQLKLKLSGDSALDVARVAEVRAAVGAGVTLTLDPNQSYGVKQMMSRVCKNGSARHRADRAALAGVRPGRHEAVDRHFAGGDRGR